MIKLYNGDCLEEMKKIPDHSVDFILCDLPYGYTDCEWDIIIPFDKLWEQYNRIITDKGVIALFGDNGLFTSKIINSNEKDFKYNWVWKKAMPTGFLNAKKQPLRNIESISIFWNTPVDNYENTERHNNKYKYMRSELEKSKIPLSNIRKLFPDKPNFHWFAKCQFSIISEEDYNKLQKETGFFNLKYDDFLKLDNVKHKLSKESIYNPQFSEGKPYIHKGGYVSKAGVYATTTKTNIVNNGTRYPTQVLEFKHDNDKLHPTQKPVKLLEYLIKTYTNEGMTVLDNCMGSGSTGVACINTNRNFIGIEKDFNYFKICKRRLGMENFEKVNPEHPDKIADRIAGAIVDLAYLKNDNPRVAVEVLIGHGKVTIINETSEAFTNEEIKSIVNRISGDIDIDYREFMQDVHLSKNQSDKIKCGDNGIFKGVPVSLTEKKLAKIANDIYSKYPYDGKYIINNDNLIICQSNLKDTLDYENAIINPLGYWTGGINVDSGATNRKLGSDMGTAVTGGGLHGKDLSKADVSVNIYAFLEAQRLNKEVEFSCAIGDDTIDDKPYEEIVKKAKDYITKLGGFEKFAEWGLIRNE